MSKNLFDYAQSKNSGVNNFDKQSKQVEDITKKYAGMGKNELEGELLKEVEKRKDYGDFDYDSICNAAKNFSQYLTPEQKNRLDELLGKIK